MARMGMEVDVVEGLGRQLKQQGANIGNVIAQIESLVNQAVSSWDGQDARDFQGWWTQQHKPRLRELQNAIDGLGQSALNNASDQRGVSGR